MKNFNITDEELNALKEYLENKYEAINQMLVNNAETDIALLSAEVENKSISIEYNRESVIEYLINIKLIYKLILKQFYNETQRINKPVYRGTNLSEIEIIKNELFIDRFLSVTENEDNAINNHASNWNRPACMNITLEKNVPYIVIEDILKDEKYKNEILVLPFTKVKDIKEDEEKKIEKSSKTLKVYNVELEKQDLYELTERERNGLYQYILENAYSIKRRIEECIILEKDNVANFENIRKLEQLLSKYENEMEEKEVSDEYSDIERNEDYDDIERITKELDELKETSTRLFEIRKQNIKFINTWKRNIAVYMIAECREIEKQFENVNIDNQNADSESGMVDFTEKTEDSGIEKINSDFQILDVKIESQEIEEQNINFEKENQIKNDDKDDTEKNENNIIVKDDSEAQEKNINEEEINVSTENNTVLDNEVKKEVTGILEDNTENIIEGNLIHKEISDKNSEMQETKIITTIDIENNEDPITCRVKTECKENIEAVEKLLADIKNLITKQQNHAKIAGKIGASYSALNNAFEMRKVSETLLEQVRNINLKVNAISKLENIKEKEEKLEKISKKNIEISTLLNYLNNPKIAARNSRVTRFDEMAIIEENELKKGIAEKIRDIRGEAELKKLKDDLEIIEEKGTISRFLGIFTGQNKLDECMLEQIEIRRSAIRRTLARKLSLAYNYSIHELMADIQMFIDDNVEDELVEDDVMDLNALADELRRNFVILETKVRSIIEEKDGRNLPLENRKMSKSEIIEIETYRFLKKYGYDVPQQDKEEPKYQDTMANEIARIVEYINSANIF